MGMVHAYQKGELDTSGMDPDLLKKVKEVAGSMKKTDAKKYAETKHKGLPELKEALRGMSFVDFLAEAKVGSKHSQYAQIKRKRASAGYPTDLKGSLLRIYQGIKQNKGQVTKQDFAEKIQGNMNLSPEAWAAMKKMQSFQDFVQNASFADGGHNYQTQSSGKRDVWAGNRVSREDRARDRASRVNQGAQDYFQR